MALAGSVKKFELILATHITYYCKYIWRHIQHSLCRHYYW